MKVRLTSGEVRLRNQNAEDHAYLVVVTPTC